MTLPDADIHLDMRDDLGPGHASTTLLVNQGLKGSSQNFAVSGSPSFIDAEPFPRRALRFTNSSQFAEALTAFVTDFSNPAQCTMALYFRNLASPLFDRFVITNGTISAPRGIQVRQAQAGPMLFNVGTSSTGDVDSIAAGWTTLFCVRDPPNLIIYKNGVPADSDAVGSWDSPAYPLRIAGSPDGAVNRDWQGDLADLRFWPSALTAEHAAEYHAAMTTEPVIPALLAGGGGFFAPTIAVQTWTIIRAPHGAEDVPPSTSLVAVLRVSNQPIVLNRFRLGLWVKEDPDSDDPALYEPARRFTYSTFEPAYARSSIVLASPNRAKVTLVRSTRLPRDAIINPQLGYATT